MAVSPGTRLGPYEVLSAIRAGGMGEVYKARDSKLQFSPQWRSLLQNQDLRQ